MQKEVIGFIIPRFFRFSETFFRDECCTWQQMGFDVKLLPVHHQKKEEHFSPYTYTSPPPPLSQNFALRALQVFRSLLYLITKGGLRPALSFFQAEHEAGATKKKIAARIYSNQHVLVQRHLSKLIFGYGNLAIEREHLARAINAKMIVAFRGADHNLFPLMYHRGIYNLTYQEADQLYFRNQKMLDEALASNLVTSNKSRVIYSKINTERFNLKTVPGTLSTPLQIVAISRFHWIKGLNYLILALSILKKEGISFRLQLIGDGEEYEHLFYLVMNYGLLDSVDFRGVKSNFEVKEELHKSDIVVCSSLSESNCRALLEGQATGNLCISTHWKGADEIIRDEETGWLVPKRDPNTLALKILEISKKQFSERYQVASNANQYVKTHFSNQTLPDDFTPVLFD